MNKKVINDYSRKKFTLCHTSNGRVRIKTSAIKFCDNKAYFVEQLLVKESGILKAEARSVTGSIIVLYDIKIITFKDLIQLLDNCLKEPVKEIVIPSDKEEQTCRLCPSPVKKKPLKKQFFRVLYLTGFLVYSVIRTMVFRSPLPQGPLSFVSYVAIRGGLPIFRQAWNDMRQGRSLSFFPFFTVTFIIAIAIGQALIAFEVIWILTLAMFLEDLIADRSLRSIRKILAVNSKSTFILVDGKEVKIFTKNVRTGDSVVVHLTDRIPVDGLVINGEALVNTATITGRAEPELIKEGDKVFAGTLVQQGRLVIRAEKVGDETYLCRIVSLVEASLVKRAPVEQKADVLAARLMKLSSVAIISTFVLTRNLLHTFSVMVVMSCPCATVLAASTAIAAAIANAARNHIIIKGGHYLELIGQADCFCFDKTGTITLEKPHVIEVVPEAYSYHAEEEILKIAAQAESHNPHPLAKALVNAAAEKGIEIDYRSTCEVFLGLGVRTQIGHDIITVGSRQFMNEQGIKTYTFNDKIESFNLKGYTVLFVAKNGEARGVIAVANPLRPGTKEVLNSLRHDGVTFLTLVTGDFRSTAEAVSHILGFDEYKAELFPEEKARYVEKLEKEGRRVVMIGDGVNDTLAFAQASISVAMAAAGVEPAIETADIAIFDNKLERLLYMRSLSHETLKTIEQNYWMAVSTDIFGLILEALGWLSPLLGGLLHITHTLGIMYNSSRLIGWQLPIKSKSNPSHSNV